MRVFLDSNVIIYSIQGDLATKQRVAENVLRISGFAPVIAVSLLSRIECCVRAIATGDKRALTETRAFLSRDDVVVVPISMEVMDRAATLRAPYKLKVPDAIQYACAIETGADVFVTADKYFTRCAEIRVCVIGSSD